MNNEKTVIAQTELERTVRCFCESLQERGIPYLLEFSGNRGFHVWITFSEKINYRVGYEIQQELISRPNLDYDINLIGLDLFPHSPIPTENVGKGVKVPLSLHAKSEYYSYFLESLNEISAILKLNHLDQRTIEKNIRILELHKTISQSEIEAALGVPLGLHGDEEYHHARIKNIKVQRDAFSLDELLLHWELHEPLSTLAVKIGQTGKLNNDERKILVGMFCNIKARNKANASEDILLEIFKKTENFNEDYTRKAIKNLSSFNFPSQKQIEVYTKVKFSRKLSIDELLRACIPKYQSFEDATFELSRVDVEVVRSAELNYLFQNDEAQSKITINDLSSRDSVKLLGQVENIMERPFNVEFYTHYRNEEAKIRTLISLKAPERVATSFILKQLVYFFDFEPSANSLGYRICRGFSGGFIYQRWLFLWIKFISRISAAIEENEYREFFIVKTDIKSFYDSIPHDNVKRLLLGGVNDRIDMSVKSLSGEAKTKYEYLIDKIFSINEKIVGSKVGLPQGPAYARYLAELYLDNLDCAFDSMLQRNEIQLYQRYVDDIFFICTTEEAARSTLKNFELQLKDLGLSINSEKTIIKKIRNFSSNFEEYRSQSKYAVDSVSRSYSDATKTQKNLAISEFMKLLYSDNCNDDLAFIYSHLIGIPNLDDWRKGKVVPILNSRIGRGSLYKHLFNFVLETKEHWIELDKVESFDVLQSEVFTSCAIVALEMGRKDSLELRRFISRMLGKLSESDLMLENIAYLHLLFDINLSELNLPPKILIAGLMRIPEERSVNASSALVRQLNTSLNDIDELPNFVEAIYPLCASPNISKQDLNELALTFYAKISNDKSKGNLLIERISAIPSPSASNKFYYLLCLYSISNKNSSTDLLNDAWKYCAYIFNSCDVVLNHKSSAWFSKIADIEYDLSKALYVISSIVDGNIFRGIEDKKKVFEMFHSLILIFIALQKDFVVNNEIDQALRKLRDKAIFYKWLIDRSESSIFPPSNKSWFEKNLIENRCIVIKNCNKVLIRRPLNEFHENSIAQSEHQGYGEIILDYDSNKYSSLSGCFVYLSLVQKLDKLIDLICKYKDSSYYPNIFCDEAILHPDTLRPFTEEFCNTETLIMDRGDGFADAIENNLDNFIKSYLNFSPERNTDLVSFREKYVDNLDSTISLFEFVRNFKNQLSEVHSGYGAFEIDMAAASAIYMCLPEGDLVRNISAFVNQYHKFNKDDVDRQIYAINNSFFGEADTQDLTATQLLDVVIKCLEIIPTSVMPTLNLYLYIDIRKYKNQFSKLLKLLETDDHSVCIDDFKRVFPRISPIENTITIDASCYKFGDMNILNLTTSEINSIDERHIVAINSSEHVYYCNCNGKAYLVSIHSAISKIYASFINRVLAFRVEGSIPDSYPKPRSDDARIAELNYFNSAVDVVAVHQDIPLVEAQERLYKWLNAIPNRFHQPLVTLISAHVTMKRTQLDEFLEYVNKLFNEPNVFLIKNPSDHNGTYRILYRNDSVARRLIDFSPERLSNDHSTATIIVDNIITGSQIISALKYYCDILPSKKSHNYFKISEEEHARIKTVLTNLSVLNICTVLYTSKALESIRNELKNIMNPELKVEVVCGKNIGDNAFFETSNKIGEAEKETIRALLQNDCEMKELYSHFESDRQFKSRAYGSSYEVNRTNLVARYKSLPKKCFKFLTRKLRHGEDCQPLIRVNELNERE